MPETPATLSSSLMFTREEAERLCRPILGHDTLKSLEELAGPGVTHRVFQWMVENMNAAACSKCGLICEADDLTDTTAGEQCDTCYEADLEARRL